MEPFPILGPPLSSATEVRRPAYMYTLYCTHLVHRNIVMHRHPVWGIRNILVRLRIPLFILIRIREPDQGSNFKLSVSGKFRVIQCCEAGAGLLCWNRSWLKTNLTPPDGSLPISSAYPSGNLTVGELLQRGENPG